jgi:hypothetical protein
MNSTKCRSLFRCTHCAEDGKVRVVIEVESGTLYSAPCPRCKEPMQLVEAEARVRFDSDLDGAPHVVMATCMRDGKIDHAWHRAMMRTPAVLAAHGIVMSELPLVGGAITHARNRLEAGFRLRTKGTHLLMVDDDVIWEPYDIVRMVRADKPILAGAYPTREILWDRVARLPRGENEMRLGASPLALRTLKGVDGRPLVEGELVEAEGVATGFLLIKREVLVHMAEAYSDLRVWCDEDSEEQCDIFQALTINGHRWTEDFVWSRRARAIGYRIWVDGVARFGHVGPYTFRSFAPLEQYEREERRRRLDAPAPLPLEISDQPGVAGGGAGGAAAGGSGGGGEAWGAGGVAGGVAGGLAGSVNAAG